MKSRNLTITYWIISIIFALLMVADGLAGILRVEGGKEALAAVGYPEYLLTVVGAAKILGVAGILQSYSKTIKEWAYAGFVFLFIGAFASHFFSGSVIGFQIFPLVLLVITLISYFLWKKVESEKL